MNCFVELIKISWTATFCNTLIYMFTVISQNVRPYCDEIVTGKFYDIFLENRRVNMNVH